MVTGIAQTAGVGLYAGIMLKADGGTAAALQLFSIVDEAGTALFGPLLCKDTILATPSRSTDFQVHSPDRLDRGMTPEVDTVAFDRRGGGTASAGPGKRLMVRGDASDDVEPTGGTRC